jgi:hypothetical protein
MPPGSQNVKKKNHSVMAVSDDCLSSSSNKLTVHQRGAHKDSFYVASSAILSDSSTAVLHHTNKLLILMLSYLCILVTKLQTLCEYSG